MKKIFLTIMSVILFYGCSHTGTPPEAVQKAFEKKFPKATKVSWGKEKAKEWEAEFAFEGNAVSANFEEDGTWLETEKEIKATDLPQAVTDTIKSKYPGWTITEADETETSKQGTIYEADLKMDSKEKEVAFKADGTKVSE